MVTLNEELAVSRQAVSRWESGESRPSTDNLQALCKLYHVPLDYLLNESRDEPQAPTPASTAAESEPEPEAQKKGKRWIRTLVIGAVILALLAGCFFWYQGGQKNDDLDLHTIPGEGNTSLEIPEFNLNWG